MPDRNYEAYEKACQKIRTDNADLLLGFEDWLTERGLAESTIKRHVDNIRFYVNEYLLYEDAVPAKEGADRISMFLGYWFIRKAMWSSPSSIKENAASLKKFYTFMHERGNISKDDLQDLKDTIKEEMPDWLGTVGRYDDPSITDPAEIWGL